VSNKRIAVLTSGGDAPGMNACIRALVISCERVGYEVIGYEHGYNGLISQEYRQLDSKKVHNLTQRGGTILRSARCLEFKTEVAAQRAADNLTDLNIDALVVIGGDGSFRGAVHLSHFWRGQIIGLPGTIDNDIFGTDATIGYYTAMETAMDAIDKVRDTADAFERIFLVEVMGRHAGFLALNGALASAANYVILPELFTDEETVIADIANQIQIHRRQYGHESYIIVLAEKLWPGGVDALSIALNKAIGGEIRPLILGHVQRGGSPKSQDRLLANMLAVEAVDAIKNEKSGIMVGIQNRQCVQVPLPQTWSNTKPLGKDNLKAMMTLLNHRHGSL
jgi:6-phosphofructokinase 1